MLDTIMQLVGGVFYLLNKIFLWLSEKSFDIEIKKRRRLFAWLFSLIGLPAWLVIFYLNRNWILGCLEAAGGPSMIIGLILAVKGKNKVPKWLDYFALTLIPIGISYSVYDFGGIKTFNQLLELGAASGFLIGNYLLAKDKASGYLWFFTMHLFAAVLMYQQSYYVLMSLQLISLGFITDAYRSKKTLEVKT